MNNNYYEYLANFNNISDNQEGGGELAVYMLTML